MHLDDEQIQRLLHGELDPRAEDATALHSASCADCRFRLEEAEREEERIFELLRRLDHATPAVDAESVAARARGSSRIGATTDANDYAATRARRAAGGSSAAVGGGALLVRMRWVAGIVFALAAVGVAYAAPGSPLPAWVSSVAAWVENPARRPAPVSWTTPTGPGSAGIAVAPSDRFVIDFAKSQAEGAVVVTLTDGSDITARALNGTATFTTDVDRLTIENGGSTADYEIEVPHDAPWVEIRVGEQRLLLKQGDRVVTDARADARGRYILPLTLPGQ